MKNINMLKTLREYIHTHTSSLENKGITLIALVITIVIILILSVIILIELTGENGIFKRAKEGKIKTEIAQYEEELNIGIFQIQTNKIDKEIKTKLTEKEIKKKLYNISSKKRRSSIFFIPNQEKFFIKEMEDSIVL